MCEVKAFLENVRIKNFLSLRDVTFPLKPLTVLVGPNASGKSNFLSALRLLNRMVIAEQPPSSKYTQNLLWAGESSSLAIQFLARVGSTSTNYEVKLRGETENRFGVESLSVNGASVISIESGEGVVRDEDGENETTYKSNKLALRSAGDYGRKPITSDLADFMRGWEFYDFQPSKMRGRVAGLEKFTLDETRKSSESPQLDDDGTSLSALLAYWHENDPERFDKVSNSLAKSANISLDYRPIDGVDQLCLLEGYEKPITLQGASDGTLRLAAYYALLNEPALRPLIAIEEPERNLHSGAFAEIADVLEQIAEQSQVIITTHSSLLLDAFSADSLSDSLGVLLLRNRPGDGTQVFDLEKIAHDNEALEGWIADFGIGSGIFESELLQNLMEEPACLA